MTLCIACGFPHILPLFRLRDQPLAALHLPRSQEEALNIEKLPLNFHACGQCGHIFNVDFDYARVPYENNSNLMYNTGEGWITYMDSLALSLAQKAQNKKSVWLEIGCGDGNFLERIGKFAADAELIGFEPGIEARNAAKRGIHAIEDYFKPQRDLEKFRPDYIICRHVIEHLQQPREFMAEIALWCAEYGLHPTFIAEVPCIEKAIKTARINDYLYEHVSNFTTESFRALFTSTGYEVTHCMQAYDDEVLVIEATPSQAAHWNKQKQTVETYRSKALQQISDVQATLRTLKQNGKSIAFWGGTGKGAAFMNSFGIAYEDFPIVVDSDYQKVGRYVPLAAQRIEPPEFLIEHPVDVIVITTQWRAKDIYSEILRRKIPHETVYVVIEQKLTPYSGETI